MLALMLVLLTPSKKGVYNLKNTELISHLFTAARRKIAVDWKQKEVLCLEERG